MAVGERVGVALWCEAELGLIVKELPVISGLAVASSTVFRSFGY